MIAILGAGLSGMSCSYHLGKDNCTIFEAKSYHGGHISSHERDGFVWDEGPHVSFTKDPYVRSILSRNLDGNFLEYEVNVGNYFEGSWIPHPAQSNLHAVPSPLRERCLEDIIDACENVGNSDEPKNYQDWLNSAFGKTFTNSFSAAYTRKYWTCEPSELTIDWIGQRIARPDLDTLLAGFNGSQPKKTHYISSVRYPISGGFSKFGDSFSKESNIKYNHRVIEIDLNNKTLTFDNGECHKFKKLINTIPLPEFINLIVDVPEYILSAASNLYCSELLLVNVTGTKKNTQNYHWFYVYDESMYSTRVSFIEELAKSNSPEGKTGIQVEVYSSQYRPQKVSDDTIATSVIKELIEMDIIDCAETVHTQRIKYANVIFNHQTKPSMDLILSWLASHGLKREVEDLNPTTNWNLKINEKIGDISLAGRFGEWKYYWTDDCILRGKFLAENI